MQILFKCPTPAMVFGNATRPSRFAHFLTRRTIPCACHAKRHLNLQKCASRHNGVHFFDISTSKSVPNLRCFLLFTYKCASRHNGVHFFISHLARWLRTRRFSEPTFRPSGATNHWKNAVFRDFPTFSRICIFFLLTLSLL